MKSFAVCKLTMTNMHSLYFNERGKNYNWKHEIKNLQWIINTFQLKTVEQKLLEKLCQINTTLYKIGLKFALTICKSTKFIPFQVWGGLFLL